MARLDATQFISQQWFVIIDGELVMLLEWLTRYAKAWENAVLLAGIVGKK